MLKWRKGVWLVVLILIVQMSIPVSGTLTINQIGNEYVEKSNLGNTLYVGGSGPNNYTHIQDAIDAALNGDTVFVYDDSSPYYENLLVDKSISLIGENKETTVIDGNDTYLKDTITIKNDSVSVSNFTIQNGSTNGIKIYTSNNKIFNNIITRNNFGIDLYGDFKIITDNIIVNNQIIDHSRGGMEINSWVTKTTVSHNIFQDSPHGIELFSTDNNIISYNIFQNIEDSGIGLWIYCHDNIISYNIMQDCLRSILLVSVWRNQVSYNLLENSDDAGVALWNNCENNTISHNIIQGNFNGIYISNSECNQIEKNTIIDNSRSILILGIYSTFNTISNNNIYQNNKNPSFRRCQINNIWNGNYWGEPRDLPKPIFGIRSIPIYSWYDEYYWHHIQIFIPWIQFDWHPAQDPYDIGG